MGQNKIIEGNKLIAEFMTPWRDKRKKSYPFPFPVIEVVPAEHLMGYGHIPEGGIKHFEGTPDMMKYHSSWDWLMPVVEKIESLGYDFSIDNCYVRIWDGGQSDFEMTFSEPTKLLTTYFAVIEFIKWYNNERK